MLYLYVFFDDYPRQASTPPTDVDIDLVASNCLQIFRWYGNAYEELTFDEGKVSWETVEEALVYEDDEELGKYHA